MKRPGSCHYCGGKATTKDHRIPIARGGDSGALNLVPACVECNTLKDDMTPGEFLEYCRDIIANCSPKQDRHRGKARVVLLRLAPDMIPKEDRRILDR